MGGAAGTWTRNVRVNPTLIWDLGLCPIYVSDGCIKQGVLVWRIKRLRCWFGENIEFFGRIVFYYKKLSADKSFFNSCRLLLHWEQGLELLQLPITKQSLFNCKNCIRICWWEKSFGNYSHYYPTFIYLHIGIHIYVK